MFNKSPLLKKSMSNISLWLVGNQNIVIRFMLSPVTPFYGILEIMNFFDIWGHLYAPKLENHPLTMPKPCDDFN